MLGDKTVPAGEYSLYVDLQEGNWTLIFSNWPAQEKYDPDNKEALWGGYGYTPDKDALRTPMHLETNDASVDQLTIVFANVTKEAGSLVILWDHTIAVAPFMVAK